MVEDWDEEISRLTPSERYQNAKDEGLTELGSHEDDGWERQRKGRSILSCGRREKTQKSRRKKAKGSSRIPGA